MKIAYYPKNTGTNDYSNRFKAILSNFGEVSGVSFKSIIGKLAKLDLARYDIIFINWLDSGIIDKRGGVRRFLFLKAILRVLLFKIVAKKLIYVRHNLYPHGTRKEDTHRAKRYSDFLMKFSGQGIVHSPTAIKPGLDYVPHPLYKSDNEFIHNQMRKISKDDYFVFFGRINKYKRLEELIRNFPSNKKLVIAGSYEDESYVEYLRKSAPENVTIQAGFIDDASAELMISSSQGLIICHADPDMIVSGSFFYALSMKSRIICVETEFLRWANIEFGDDVVVCFKDINDLHDKISRLPPAKVFDDDIVERIQHHFGEVSVSDKVKVLL